MTTNVSATAQLFVCCFYTMSCYFSCGPFYMGMIIKELFDVSIEVSKFEFDRLTLHSRVNC